MDACDRRRYSAYADFVAFQGLSCAQPPVEVSSRGRAHNRFTVAHNPRYLINLGHNKAYVVYLRQEVIYR